MMTAKALFSGVLIHEYQLLHAHSVLDTERGHGAGAIAVPEDTRSGSSSRGHKVVKQRSQGLNTGSQPGFITLIPIYYGLDVGKPRAL